MNKHAGQTFSSPRENTERNGTEVPGGPEGFYLLSCHRFPGKKLNLIN